MLIFNETDEIVATDVYGNKLDNFDKIIFNNGGFLNKGRIVLIKPIGKYKNKKTERIIIKRFELHVLPIKPQRTNNEKYYTLIKIKNASGVIKI